MSTLVLDDANAIAYHWTAPAVGRPSAVFYNPLTGDFSMWEAAIAPALRAAGIGTLVWNYRGQQESPIGADVRITAEQVTGDAVRLLAHVAPPLPIHVGHSIGGYFAIRAREAGAAAAGLVLINTLRADGPRLAWINDALVACAQVGGLPLLRDLYAPLLFGEAWQRGNRGNFLKNAGYAPLAADATDLRLLQAGSTADWSIAWETVDLPVTVLTGREDRVFLDTLVVEGILARLPQATAIMVETAGHMLPVETPAPVIEACLALADQVARQP
jgi:3-oxoadipate enol-lactonase